MPLRSSSENSQVKSSFILLDASLSFPAHPPHHPCKVFFSPSFSGLDMLKETITGFRVCSRFPLNYLFGVPNVYCTYVLHNSELPSSSLLTFLPFSVKIIFFFEGLPVKNLSFRLTMSNFLSIFSLHGITNLFVIFQSPNFNFMMDVSFLVYFLFPTSSLC